MKKSDFIVLISYTLSLLVLALGICLYTLPGWGMPTLGLPPVDSGLDIGGLDLDFTKAYDRKGHTES